MTVSAALRAGNVQKSPGENVRSSANRTSIPFSSGIHVPACTGTF